MAIEISLPPSGLGATVEDLAVSSRPEEIVCRYIDVDKQARDNGLHVVLGIKHVKDGGHVGGDGMTR